MRGQTVRQRCASDRGNLNAQLSQNAHMRSLIGSIVGVVSRGLLERVRPTRMLATNGYCCIRVQRCGM